MLRRLAKQWPEVLLTTFTVALLYFQLFSPSYIGIGNNGDFTKVCMQFCLGPVDGWGDNFRFFEPDYTRKPQYCWKSDMRVTEYLAAWTGLKLAGWFGRAEPFNLRWMGLVHGALLMAALLLFLRAIGEHPPVVRFLLGAFAVWVAFDIRYVSYLNSFYMDTTAFLGLFFVVLAAWEMVRRPTPSYGALAAYAVAVVFFAMSKSAHGINAWVAATLPIALWPALRTPKRKAAAIAAAAVCIAVAVASVALTPKGYKGQALYNVVFYRILGNSQNPAADAAELGIPAEELKFAGTYAFKKDSPGRKLSWVQGFYERTGFSRLIRYYLRHPRFVLDDLASDLKYSAPMMRSPGVSNFRREAGYPAGTQSDRFATWTALRTKLFELWPAHAVVWYTAVIAGSLWAFRNPRWRGGALILLGLSLMAGLEFGVACLADAVETDRHLYIFHTITDVTLVVVAVFVASAVRPMRRFAQHPELEAAAKHSY